MLKRLRRKVLVAGRGTNEGYRGPARPIPERVEKGAPN
jgi:hypothetical protein